MNAVAAAGLERERMREALAAALIKDEADRAVFDESFERFFATPRAARGAHPDHRGEQVSAAAGRGKPGENPSAARRCAACARQMSRAKGRARRRRDEKSHAAEAKHAKKESATRRDGAEREDDGRDSDKSHRREQGDARCARRIARRQGSTPRASRGFARSSGGRSTNISDFGLRRGARGARATDSPLPDSARAAAAAGEAGQNRFPAHDSRGDAARRRADRSQFPRAAAASRRSRDPRRHFGIGPLRGAVDARVDGGRARMFSPRQQFRLRGPSGGGGFRAGPSGDDAGAGPLRAIGFRPRARRVVGASDRLADARHAGRDHGRRAQQPAARARRPDSRDRARLPRRGVAESGGSRALGHGRQCDQAVCARSQGGRAVAQSARAASGARGDR